MIFGIDKKRKKFDLKSEKKLPNFDNFWKKIESVFS